MLRKCKKDRRKDCYVHFERAKLEDYLIWLAGYVNAGSEPTHFHKELSFYSMNLFTVKEGEEGFRTTEFENCLIPQKIIIPEHMDWPWINIGDSIIYIVGNYQAIKYKYVPVFNDEEFVEYHNSF